jgi:hypothetical protein
LEDVIHEERFLRDRRLKLLEGHLPVHVRVQRLKQIADYFRLRNIESTLSQQ